MCGMRFRYTTILEFNVLKKPLYGTMVMVWNIVLRAPALVANGRLLFGHGKQTNNRDSIPSYHLSLISEIIVNWSFQDPLGKMLHFSRLERDQMQTAGGESENTHNWLWYWLKRIGCLLSSACARFYLIWGENLTGTFSSLNVSVKFRQLWHLLDCQMTLNRWDFALSHIRMWNVLFQLL